MSTQKETIALPTPLVQEVLTYLGARPYQEVYQMIAQLMRAGQASQPSPTPPAETEPEEK